MPDFSLEKETGKKFVFGVDEAGRGPLCGPVVAACVCWPEKALPSDLAEQINDSKKLSAAKREILFEKIFASGAIIGIGEAQAEEIDRINILQATFLAMERALQEVEKQGIIPEFVLIDGNRLPRWNYPKKAVIKGDSLSLSIAAASIIAKVTRDRLMTQLAKAYPQYGWEKNAGYGTRDHLQALALYGKTPHHRQSFAPVAACCKKYA